MSKDRKREKSTRKKGSSLPAFDFGEGLLKGKATEDSEAAEKAAGKEATSDVTADESAPEKVIVEEVTLDSMVIDDPPTEDLIIADATDSIYDSAPVKKIELPAFGFAEDLLREYRAKQAAEKALGGSEKSETPTAGTEPPTSESTETPNTGLSEEDPSTREISFGDVVPPETENSTGAVHGLVGPGAVDAVTPGAGSPAHPSETQTLTFDTTEMKAAIAVESTDGTAEDRIFAFADSLNARIGQEEQVKAKRLETWLTLILADELFALPVEPVRQVLRLSSITRVPHAPKPIRGVTNVRGRVIPVIDLRLRLDLPESALDRGSRIVVVHSRGRLLGLLVDAVQQVVHLDMDLVQPPPDDVMTRQSDYISGVYDWQDRLLLLLDVDRALILREASANFGVPQEPRRSSPRSSAGWGDT